MKIETQKRYHGVFETIADLVDCKDIKQHLSQLKEANMPKPVSVYVTWLADNDVMFDKKYRRRIYLCRHGETESNKLKLLQGSGLNGSLNETGRQQASQLGTAFKDLHHIIKSLESS